MKKYKPRYSDVPPPGKLWEHTGGGTAMGGHPYPSDDSYVHLKTKRRINVTCTMAAHFSMPDWVRRPSDLSRRAGVSCIEVLPPFPEDR